MKENKLLQRQIKKYLPEELAGISGIVPFLQAVAASYYAFEKDSVLSERAFKMSEEEYMEVNEKLQKELEQLRMKSAASSVASAADQAVEINLLGPDALELLPPDASPTPSDVAGRG